MCHRSSVAVAAGATVVLPGGPSPAMREGGLSPAAQRGLVLVQTNCARRHLIAKISPRSFEDRAAVPQLHEPYPAESLQVSRLAKGS